MSRTFDELLQALARMPGVRVAGPATLFAIADAEAALGASISGQYRHFLETVGCADLRGNGVLGVGPGVPPALRVVRALDEARRGTPPLPPHLLPVHLDGGQAYCLDTREVPEPPVVLFEPELGPDQLPFRVAGSFGEWLARMVEATEAA